MSRPTQKLCGLGTPFTDEFTYRSPAHAYLFIKYLDNLMLSAICNTPKQSTMKNSLNKATAELAIMRQHTVLVFNSRMIQCFHMKRLSEDVCWT